MNRTVATELETVAEAVRAGGEIDPAEHADFLDAVGHELETLRDALRIVRNVLVTYEQGFRHDATQCRHFLKELDDATGR